MSEEVVKEVVAETEKELVVKTYRYYIEDLMIEDNYIYEPNEDKIYHTQSLKLKVPESSGVVSLDFLEPKLNVEVVEELLKHLKNSDEHFLEIIGKDKIKEEIPKEEVPTVETVAS